MTKPSLPKKGMSPESVLGQLQAQREKDVDWKGGKTFSLVYYAGDQVMQLLHDAYSMFMAENGLSPMAFPSLKQMENEVVAMTADMLHGGEAAAGSMTSGGTESIFMAMKTAREWCRKNKPSVAKPKIVAPVSAHPAFVKSAHYLDMQIDFTPPSSMHRRTWSSTDCSANHFRIAGSSRWLTSKPNAFSVVTTPRHASDSGECRTKSASQIMSAWPA